MEPAASPPDGPAVVAVVGPTATGKSDLAVAIALALGGEVVNADASQLYRGMDIGTAKLPPEQRCGVPHHQLDVLDVTEEASLAAYQRHARATVDALRSRGTVPVVAGGSALYLRALLEPLDIPPTDPGVRAALEAELERSGAAELHARLARVDPAAAAGILPGNGRRVVRALEVVEITGRPFAARLPETGYRVPTVVLGLVADHGVLDPRIGARVDRMWRDGLVDEVEGLRPAGIERGRTARRAIGYAQVLDLLAGRTTEEQAREDTVRATRRLVRRQESWFRRDRRSVTLPAGAPDLLDRALAAVRAGATVAP